MNGLAIRSAPGPMEPAPLTRWLRDGFPWCPRQDSNLRRTV